MTSNDKESTPKRRARSSPLSFLSGLLRQPKAIVGLVILLVFTLMAVFAPLIAPGDPSRFVARQNQPPSTQHWLGTTGQGQDVFQQMVWGSRISLGIGFSVGLLTTLIGLVVGMVAGYLHGIVDGVLNLFTNVFLIIPGLPLLITLASYLPPGTVTVILVLTFTGEGIPYIVFVEILPNMFSLVVSSFFGATAYAIGADAGLAFLGFEDVNAVSWGTMLFWASNNSALLMGTWWTFVPPGLCIALVAFATTLLIYAMDDVTNPRLKSEKEIVTILKRAHLSAGRATPVVQKGNVHAEQP